MRQDVPFDHRNELSTEDMFVTAKSIVDTLGGWDAQTIRDARFEEQRLVAECKEKKEKLGRDVEWHGEREKHALDEAVALRNLADNHAESKVEARAKLEALELAEFQRVKWVPPPKAKRARVA